MIGQTYRRILRRNHPGEARQAEPDEDRPWLSTWQGSAMARSRHSTFDRTSRHFAILRNFVAIGE